MCFRLKLKKKKNFSANFPTIERDEGHQCYSSKQFFAADEEEAAEFVQFTIDSEVGEKTSYD